MADLVMTVTATAEAEVTKAADIRQWRIYGVFEDDLATVEFGNNAVYVSTAAHIFTGDRAPEMNTTCMLLPDNARELARALNAAADKAMPPKDEEPQ